METRYVSVFDSRGRAVSAEVLVCNRCEGEVWVCFVIEEQTHWHFQCVGCNTSYCPDEH